jgi:hypothetical protein
MVRPPFGEGIRYDEDEGEGGGAATYVAEEEAVPMVKGAKEGRL